MSEPEQKNEKKILSCNEAINEAVNGGAGIPPTILSTKPGVGRTIGHIDLGDAEGNAGWESF